MKGGGEEKVEERLGRREAEKKWVEEEVKEEGGEDYWKEGREREKRSGNWEDHKEVQSQASRKPGSMPVVLKWLL